MPAPPDLTLDHGRISHRNKVRGCGSTASGWMLWPVATAGEGRSGERFRHGGRHGGGAGGPDGQGCWSGWTAPGAAGCGSPVMIATAAATSGLVEVT